MALQTSHSFHVAHRPAQDGDVERELAGAHLEPGDGFGKLFKRSKSALWKVSESELSRQGVSDLVHQLRRQWSKNNLSDATESVSHDKSTATMVSQRSGLDVTGDATTLSSCDDDDDDEEEEEQESDVFVVDELHDDMLTPQPLAPATRLQVADQAAADSTSSVVPEGLAARAGLSTRARASSAASSVHDITIRPPSSCSGCGDDDESVIETAGTRSVVDQAGAQEALIRALEVSPHTRSEADIEFLTDYLYSAAPKLFKELPRSAVQTVAKKATVSVYRYNEVLFTQQQRGDTFYLVLQGQVKVFVATGAQAITRLQAAAREYQAASSAYEERVETAAAATAARVKEVARHAGQHDLLESVGPASPGRGMRSPKSTVGGGAKFNLDGQSTPAEEDMQARRAAALSVGVSRLPEDKESLRWRPLLFVTQRSAQPPGLGREANEVRHEIRRRQIAAKAACSMRPDLGDPSVAWWLATSQRRELAQFLSGNRGQLPPPGPALRPSLSRMPPGMSDDNRYTLFNLLGHMLGYNNTSDMACPLRQPKFIPEEALGNHVVTLGPGAGFGELALLGSARAGSEVLEDLSLEQQKARAEEEDRASRRNATVVAVGAPQFDPVTGLLLDEEDMQARTELGAAALAQRRGGLMSDDPAAAGAGTRDDEWHKRVARNGVTVLLCIDRATYLESLNVKMRQEIQNRVEYLQHSIGIGLFKSWLPRRLAPIAYALQPVDFMMREHLFTRGQPVRGMYFIVEGTVKLSAHASRDAPAPALAASLAEQTSNRGVIRRRIHNFGMRQQLLEVQIATLGPGGIVAELTPSSLLPGAKYNISAQAASSRVQAYFLPQHDVLNLLLAQTDTFVLVHLEAEGRRRARAIRDQMQQLGLATAPGTPAEPGSLAQQYAFHYMVGDELWESGEQASSTGGSSGKAAAASGRGGSAAMSAALSAARRAVIGSDQAERGQQDGKSARQAQPGPAALAANPSAPGGVLDPARPSAGPHRTAKRYEHRVIPRAQQVRVDSIAGSREAELLLHRDGRHTERQRAAGLAGFQPDDIATATRAVRTQVSGTTDGGAKFAIAPVPSLSSAGQRRTPSSPRGAVEVRVPTARLHDTASLAHLMVGAATALPLALPPLPGPGAGEYVAAEGSTAAASRKPRLPQEAKAASQRWTRSMPGSASPSRLDAVRPEQRMASALALGDSTGQRSSPARPDAPMLPSSAERGHGATWHTDAGAAESRMGSSASRPALGSGRDPLDANTRHSSQRTVAGSTLAKFKPWAPGKRPGGAQADSRRALRAAGAMATARIGPTSEAVSAATGKGARAAAAAHGPSTPSGQHPLLQRVRTEFGARPAPRKLKDTPLSLQRLSQQDYWRRLTAAVGVAGGTPAAPGSRASSPGLVVGEASHASAASLPRPTRGRRASFARRDQQDTTVIDARMHQVVTDAPARQRRISMAATQAMRQSASVASGLGLSQDGAGSAGALPGGLAQLPAMSLDMLPLSGRLLHNRATASSMHAQMYHRLGGTMDLAALQQSAGFQLTAGEMEQMQAEMADPGALAELQWDFPAHLAAYQLKGLARRQQYERGAREQDVSAAIKALSMITGSQDSHMAASGRLGASPRSPSQQQQQQQQGSQQAVHQLLAAVGSAGAAALAAKGEAHGRVALNNDVAGSSGQNMDAVYAQRVLASARKAAARRKREDKRRSMQRLQDQAAWYGGKLPMAATMQTLGDLGGTQGADMGGWVQQTGDGFAASDSTSDMPAWARRMVQSERRLRRTRSEQVQEALDQLDAKLRSRHGDDSDEESAGAGRRGAAAGKRAPRGRAHVEARPWRDQSITMPGRVVLAQGGDEQPWSDEGDDGPAADEAALDEWLRTRGVASRRPDTAGGVYSDHGPGDGGVDSAWRPVSPTGVAHVPMSAYSPEARRESPRPDESPARRTQHPGPGQGRLQRDAAASAQRRNKALQRRFVVRGRGSMPTDALASPGDGVHAEALDASPELSRVPMPPAAAPKGNERRGPTLTAATLAALSGTDHGHGMFEVTAAMDSAAAASLAAAAPRWSVGSMAPLYTLASRAAASAQRAASQDVAVKSMQAAGANANPGTPGTSASTLGVHAQRDGLPMLMGAFRPLSGSTLEEEVPATKPPPPQRGAPRGGAPPLSPQQPGSPPPSKPMPPPARNRLPPGSPSGASPRLSRGTIPCPPSTARPSLAASTASSVSSASSSYRQHAELQDAIGMGGPAAYAAGSSATSKSQPAPVGSVGAPPRVSSGAVEITPQPASPAISYTMLDAYQSQGAAIAVEAAKSPASPDSVHGRAGFLAEDAGADEHAAAAQQHWAVLRNVTRAAAAFRAAPLLASQLNGRHAEVEQLAGATARPGAGLSPRATYSPAAHASDIVGLL